MRPKVVYKSVAEHVAAVTTGNLTFKQIQNIMFHERLHLELKRVTKAEKQKHLKQLDALARELIETYLKN